MVWGILHRGPGLPGTRELPFKQGVRSSNLRRVTKTLENTTFSRVFAIFWNWLGALNFLPKIRIGRCFYAVFWSGFPDFGVYPFKSYPRQLCCCQFCHNFFWFSCYFCNKINGLYWIISKKPVDFYTLIEYNSWTNMIEVRSSSVVLSITAGWGERERGLRRGFAVLPEGGRSRDAGEDPADCHPTMGWSAVVASYQSIWHLYLYETMA